MIWLLVAVAVAGCARAGGEPFQPTVNTPLPLASEDSVGQSFTPATGTVAGVDLLVATYGAPADPDGRLRITVSDGVGGPVLATATVAGTDLEDAAWVRVDLDGVPAPGVAAVEATWEGDSPLALWANVPPADVDPGEQPVNDPYPGGRLLLDGAPAEGDLAFRVRGSGSPGDAAAQVVEVVASAGNRLLEQPVFAVLWVAVLVAAIATAWWGLRRRGAGDRDAVRR